VVYVGALEELDNGQGGHGNGWRGDLIGRMTCGGNCERNGEGWMVRLRTDMQA
jgi:hypothetical protein